MIGGNPGSRMPLTQAQLEQSQTAEQFESVKPSQLFGPNADPILAALVHRTNIVRYRALRDLWLMEVGDIARDPAYYGV